MTAQALLILLTGHFVADFLAQTDWMATNKSKSWYALTLHVSVYSAIMTVVCGAVLLTAEHRLLFGAWTFITHFLTDAATSRLTTRYWFFTRIDGIWRQVESSYPKHGRDIVSPWLPDETGKRHAFFVAIGFDQLIHAWTLALTYLWVVR